MRLGCINRLANLLLCSCLLWILHAQAEGQEKIALVGMRLNQEVANASDPSDLALAEKASDQLHIELSKKKQYTLVEKSQVTLALRVMEAKDSQCASVACMTEVGRSIGADWIIGGEVKKISTLIWLVSARMIDVKNVKVFRQETLELKGNFSDLIRPGMASLTRRIVDGE